jgi:sugar lactone lactonase YvrE
MRRFAITILLTSIWAASPSHAAELWRATGFKTPESILYDQVHHRLIVSNINGTPVAADGNGYLSLLSMDGKMITAEWATGMDAPKGMAIFGDHLYAADINKIREIDLTSGKVTKTIPVDGAVFLNDVTASPSGDVYVTDMMGNAIYRLHNGALELWLKDDALNTPNGILFMGDHLIVGTWGHGMKKDFTTETPGGLISVDLATKAISPVPHAERFGNIDGIVEADGALIVTDYIAGILWRCAPGKAPERMASLKAGSADLGTDGTVLYVPMMNEGEVVALPVH